MKRLSRGERLKRSLKSYGWLEWAVYLWFAVLLARCIDGQTGPSDQLQELTKATSASHSLKR